MAEVKGHLGGKEVSAHATINCSLKNLGVQGKEKWEVGFLFIHSGSMQDTGCLGLVHWDDPEGWYGEGGGRGVQVGEHMYTRGGFMLMYG